MMGLPIKSSCIIACILQSVVCLMPWQTVVAGLGDARMQGVSLGPAWGQCGISATWLILTCVVRGNVMIIVEQRRQLADNEPAMISSDSGGVQQRRRIALSAKTCIIAWLIARVELCKDGKQLSNQLVAPFWRITRYRADVIIFCSRERDDPGYPCVANQPE